MSSSHNSNMQAVNNYEMANQALIYTAVRVFLQH